MPFLSQALMIGPALLLAAAILAAPATTQQAPPHPAANKMAYWQTQHRGANGFCENYTEQWFIDLHAAGIDFCRLAVGKTKSTSGGRDFLIGNADDFKTIPRADLQQLLQIVDWAGEHDVHLVIVPLSLPGCRWQQQNDGQTDKRLWSDLKYHIQAAAFWKELATALKDKPNIIGYEILNEPCPERAFGAGDEFTTNLAALQQKVRGTPADINVLYRSVLPAIRSVDPETPVILSASFYGFAGSVPFLEPASDQKSIYTFHTYTPYELTTFKVNNGRFHYPGPAPTGGKTENWDGSRIEKHVAPVAQWAARNQIPASRIFVGEFGCDRRVPGAAAYLKDSIDVFNHHGWHWAFYAFREDVWDAMDYELGATPLPGRYWQDLEQGKHPALPRKPNPLWDAIKAGLSR